MRSRLYTRCCYRLREQDGLAWEPFHSGNMFHRSEGFPARDIWFLGTLDQGSARSPKLLGRRHRRCHLILPGGRQAPPDFPFKLAYQPPGFTDLFAGLPVGWLACFLVCLLACWMAELFSCLLTYLLDGWLAFLFTGLLVGWLAC